MVSIDELKRNFRPNLTPLKWDENRKSLLVLDQSLLPFQTSWIEAADPQAVADSIRLMRVRGAPAIGIAAAYGMVTAITSGNPSTIREGLELLSKSKLTLDSSRPTAVNLSWATSRMLSKANNLAESGEVRKVQELLEVLEKEAKTIYEEELDAELRMGLYGLEKLNDGDVVLTQCNAGGLATGTGLGTALAPIKVAHSLGIKVSVIAPETRPWLQGSRLTAYELMTEGIPVTVISDTAVGLVMYKGMVNSVMVGADRILGDGHVFNKVGTFKEAVISHELGIPFYVLAPSSTFDLKSRAEDVKIEERDPNEVRTVRGVPVAPEGVKVYNPVFDVTPPKYVSALITEMGIIYPPFEKNVRKILGR